MTRYVVGVRAWAGFDVEADTPEDAAKQAYETAVDMGNNVEFDIDPVNLEDVEEAEDDE